MTECTECVAPICTWPGAMAFVVFMVVLAAGAFFVLREFER